MHHFANGQWLDLICEPTFKKVNNLLTSGISMFCSAAISFCGTIVNVTVINVNQLRVVLYQMASACDRPE